MLGEYPWPAPLHCNMPIFVCQGIGKSSLAPTVHQIPFGYFSNPFQMVMQLLRQPFRKQRASVLSAFSAAYGEFPAVEIKVLHHQPKGLHQSQATAMEHSGHQLPPVAHNRQALRLAGSHQPLQIEIPL